MAPPGRRRTLLAELIDDGLVAIDHERLIVPDLDALERRAER